MTWNIEECKAYAVQLRDKNRANTAEAIEFLLVACDALHITKEPLLHPPRRTWVGLTDENIFAVLATLQEMYNSPPKMDSRVIFARAIEAKLKELNT